ncbi:MAG: hypothetical protein FWE25_08795 [Lachnospiraceae bacterium]|nr:hypothetical protein [Lachnospiraceae bacterium]
MAIVCFRYLGMKSFAEVDALYLEEYRILIKALELRKVDEERNMHWQAFLNFAVKAEKKSGKNKTKPVYTKFEQFFHYEKAIERLKKRDGQEKGKSVLSGLNKFLKKEKSDDSGAKRKSNDKDNRPRRI